MAAVTLEFIGCGDAFASGGRFQTCFLVRGSGRALPDRLRRVGSAVALQRRGWTCRPSAWCSCRTCTGTTSAACPSCCSMPPTTARASTPLVVAGPPGIEARVLGTLEPAVSGHARVGGRARACPVSSSSIRVHADRARRRRSHRLRSGALVQDDLLRAARERGRKVIAYSGDTQWTPALVELSRGADLFVCECAGFDAPLYSHLSHAELSAHASDFDGVRMLLTHLGPEMLARRCGERGGPARRTAWSSRV